MHVLAEKADPCPVDQQPVGVAGPAQRLHQRRAQGHAQVLGGQFVGRRHAQVLARHGVRHEGYVDEGWKDTVLLMPGERIRILVKFGDYPGLFLYHCHNLEHEDMGMMRNYLVEGSRASV